MISSKTTGDTNGLTKRPRPKPTPCSTKRIALPLCCLSPISVHTDFDRRMSHKIRFEAGLCASECACVSGASGPGLRQSLNSGEQ